jgi:hypothetical protein
MIVRGIRVISFRARDIAAEMDVCCYFKSILFFD